eukprot:1076836-Amphidinium_carterae.1
MVPEGYQPSISQAPSHKVAEDKRAESSVKAVCTRVQYQLSAIVASIRHMSSHDCGSMHTVKMTQALKTTATSSN